MRRQTLVLVPVAAALLAVMAGLALFVRGTARAAMDFREARSVAFGSVSLPLPGAFRPSSTRTNRTWSIQEFQARGVGTLQLASEPQDGTAFEAACLRWFSLPAWSPEPQHYRSRGRDRFFQPLPLFRQGAYSMHKEGKMLRLVACFDQGEHRHWLELRTSQGFLPEQEVFHALLLSLRGAEGAGPGRRLGAALAAIPGETRYRFLLPLEALGFFPLLILLLPSLLLWTVARRSGRLPDAPEAVAQAAFCRPFVEIGLVGGGQWKFLVACISVAGGDLLIHTFGTPLLRIPRGTLTGRVTVGRGWIDPPYLELPLEPPAEFLKRRWLYGLLPGRFKLRIYSQDLGTLRAALGA